MTTSKVDNKAINIAFDLFDKKSDAFQPIRKEALESFDRIGFPSTKNEEWKYTNLKGLAQQDLKFKTDQLSATKETVDRFRIAGKDASVLVFENGIFRNELSDTLHQQNKIIVKNLASVIHTTEVTSHLGKIASFSNESFVALNTAFVNDGVFIQVPAYFISGQTIHIMHINSTTDAGYVSTVRNLVIAEKSSKVAIVESYHSINDDCNGFTNSVTEVLVKENAQVELVKAQLESVNTSQVSFTQVIQEKNSLFDTVTVTLSGSLVRNNLHIKLDDVNCTSHLYGLYILDGEQLVDNHTLVDHAKPHCFSNELYKGLIGGRASAVFNGKIFVRKDAQKTNAYQSNKNILLSDNAQINTKPQLEIFADDVKCTHGTTTGQMDEEALFYLRARGIGEQNARALLNIAFASDVLNNIKNDTLRESLLNLAVDKLHRNEL